ncbi:MAG: hypothetical protein NZZ41_05200 [Candidatus Dojkabacteria bacterium]|nr:hypothetical protein [Candidatus Dojkabacteria bacterium]
MAKKNIIQDMQEFKDSTSSGHNSFTANSSTTKFVMPDLYASSKKMFSTTSKPTDGINSSNANPGKIMFLIILIVVIGMGSALIIRNLAINNQTDQINNQKSKDISTSITPTQEVIQQTSKSLVVNNVQQEDSSAENPPTVNSFTDSIMVKGGQNTTNKERKLLKIEITQYTTFNRITFIFDDSDLKVPEYIIQFDDIKNIINIKFNGLVQYEKELTQDTKINGILKEVRFDTINKKHILLFNNKLKYRVFDKQNRLFLDFVYINIINTITPTPSPTLTTTPTSIQSNNIKPTPPFFENQFSINQQYISNNINSNNILHNTFAVEDEGSYFEFIFASRNNVGNNFIPNSTAYWENDTTLVWEVENLGRTFMFDSQTPEYKNEITAMTIQNNIGVNMSNANFIKIKLRSYSNGKAVYEIKTKNKSQFRILAKVVNIPGSGNSQGIAIQIKD